MIRMRETIVMPTSMFFNERRRLVDLAAKNRLPAVYPAREFVDAGGLMAYGSDLADSFRRAATYVDKNFSRVRSPPTCPSSGRRSSSWSSTSRLRRPSA